jgi:hypothetical protein
VRFNTDLNYYRRLPRYCLPVPVKYQKQFPRLNYYKDHKTSELIFTVLGTKSIEWAHEEEWRLVAVGYSGPMRLPPEMIDGVILGMRVEPKAEATIREWISARTPKIELLRVVNRPNSFQLELVSA